jgi:sulfur-carrier protein
MQLHLLYFAALRDLAQCSEETFDVAAEGPTVSALCDEVQKAHPRLSFVGVRVAVNEEFVDSGFVLQAGDVVAFIPPVSGG